MAFAVVLVKKECAMFPGVATRVRSQRGLTGVLASDLVLARIRVAIKRAVVILSDLRARETHVRPLMIDEIARDAARLTVRRLLGLDGFPVLPINVLMRTLTALLARLSNADQKRGKFDTLVLSHNSQMSVVPLALRP
jgi:hypothetical protein